MSKKYPQLSLENQLCFPLYAAARKVTSLYTPYLKPLGMTYTQYLVFMVLWEEDPLTVGDICEKLYLDSGTMTPLLKKMEDKGWIKRTRSKEDERVVVIVLTEEGRALEEKCAQIPSGMGSCIHLGTEEAAILYKTLYQLIGTLGAKE